MVLAVGTGRALRALPKANRPRGGRGFIGQGSRLSSKQAWRFCPAPRGYVHLVPVFCWKAEGDVGLGFGAGVAGLGCVLPRGPGSGESAVAHRGGLKLLSGGELGGKNRGAWLLAPWARWRRRQVGGVDMESGVPSTTWAQI